MDALDAIMTRHSVRAYTSEPVSDADVETILRAAMAAPSASNQQPWQFIVLRDRDQLTAVAGATPYGSMLPGCGVALVVCGDTRELKHSMMWQQDCAAATQNALLAAHAMGLGAVWLGFWPVAERVAVLKEVLDMPEGVEPMAVISIGHPAGPARQADRYDAARIHMDRWA